MKFYDMIIQNSNEVEKAGNKGIGKVKSLKAEVQPFTVKDLKGFYVKVAIFLFIQDTLVRWTF